MIFLFFKTTSYNTAGLPDGLHITEFPWLASSLTGTIAGFRLSQRATPALNIERSRLFQLFKYAVYALLTANIFIFFSEEWAAAPHRFANGVALKDMIEGFAATVDTASWVILLLMFELETYILDDNHFTPRVTWTLHSLRAICYTFIVYSFYGYVTKLTFILGATPLPGVTELCSLVDGAWAYAVDLDEYAVLSAGNCQDLSPATSFLQLPGLTALVDRAGLIEIARLAWVDVINAGVWLLVVVVLELDVWLQEHDRLDGVALKFSNFSKLVLYFLLFLAALYWGFKGDFVDFWDAFLWLVAFVFIELNVFEWRKESIEERQDAIL
jgi:hypothetical protein